MKAAHAKRIERGERWRTPARLLFWCAVLTVLVLTQTPSRMMPSIIFNVWDKAQHALAFGALAVLGTAGYPRQRIAVAIGLLVFGGAIEIAQWLTGWRQGDWLDLLADAIGIGVALIVTGYWLGSGKRSQPA